jgi:hypothetical protein
VGKVGVIELPRGEKREGEKSGGEESRREGEK